MPLSTAEIDSLLATWASNASYASVHSAYSSSGANELSGGSYARVAVTWGSPAGAAVSLTGTPYSVNIPASSTAAFVGFWSALTGGTFQGMFPGGNYSAYAFTGPSATSVILAPGSAYTNGTTVCVFNSPGSVLPGGLTVGTVYYIISASGDSFELSATSGGSAITISADGSGIVQQIAVELFTSAGAYSLSGATVSGV
jgi:hypothetical protein